MPYLLEFYQGVSGEDSEGESADSFLSSLDGTMEDIGLYESMLPFPLPVAC